MHVLFGNVNPKVPPEGLADATQAAAEAQAPEQAEETVTLFTPPDSDSLIEQVLPTITKTWAQAHSDSPPSWVASDNEAAAQLLAANYKVEVRDVHEAMTTFQRLIRASQVGIADAPGGAIDAAGTATPVAEVPPETSTPAAPATPPAPAQAPIVGGM